MSEIEDSVFLKKVLKQRKPNQSVTLAFGPEGGWVQPELDLFQRAGWASASLGPTVLRSETAAIAATAVTMSELQ
jgi:16S rRNA (uracil1498-N3)-methyltransferase